MPIKEHVKNVGMAQERLLISLQPVESAFHPA